MSVSSKAGQFPKNTKKLTSADVLLLVLLALWAMVIFYPFYNAILTSVVPYGVYIRQPFMLFPPELDFSSYQFIFSWSHLWDGFRTTFIVLVFGVSYNMFLTVTLAYVLSKPIPGRRFFNMLIVFTMFFSGGMIPSYLLVQNLGMMDTYASMIVPIGISITNMMIMRSYFGTIPNELEEAAKLDGAGEITILTRIYLPLSTPMLATIGLYYSVDRWNEWYNGMLYIRSIEKQPLQLVIKSMLESQSAVIGMIPVDVRPNAFPQGIQMAGVLVAVVPIAMLYPFLQRFFVKGLTLGGVKS